MTFELSKILWPLVEPGNFLLMLLAVGSGLWLGGRRAGRRLVIGVTAAAAVLAVAPVGTWLILPLENRFPTVAEVPGRIAGIVVLGGVVDPWLTRGRGQVAIGGAVERLTEAAMLARRFPEAKIVFSGGSGSLVRQEFKEADVVEPLFELLGIGQGRVVLENGARNTFENAVLTRALVEPAPDQTWILITSALHMPRAVGCFRRAGWRVLAYPVDYATRREDGFRLGFDLVAGLSRLSVGVHEWLGLAIYRLLDRTDALFPAP